MKVFISHSSKDKKFVRTLKSDLNENGIDTFVDEDSLELGDSLKERLDVGLDESSHFVIILSENSVNSDWVKYELNEASKLYDNNTLKKIIPIKYRECEIPEKLIKLIYGDLSNEIVQNDHDKDNVKFITKGYSEFLVQLIQTLRSSDKKLTKEDKKEIKKEAFESEKKLKKSYDGFFNIRHKILRYKDGPTLRIHKKRIAEARNSTSFSTFMPILLPPVYRTIFKTLKVGDELMFSKNGEKIIKGHFAGFKPVDTGLTVHPEIRNNLGIEPGRYYYFTVNVEERHLIFNDGSQ